MVPVVQLLNEFTSEVTAHGKKFTFCVIFNPVPKLQTDGPLALDHQSSVALTTSSPALVSLRTPAALVELRLLLVSVNDTGKSPDVPSESMLTAAVEAPLNVSPVPVKVAPIG